MDLIVTHMFRQPDLFRNSPKSAKPAVPSNWIGFSLVGAGPNAPDGAGHACSRSAIGSQVRVSYRPASGGPITQLRELQAISGFSAQGDRRLHFGLGDYRGEVTAEVEWCGMGREVFAGLRPGRYHELVMGHGAEPRMALNK
jgi:hypothetical protein